MFMSQLKKAAAVLMAVAVCGLAVGAITQQENADANQKIVVVPKNNEAGKARQCVILWMSGGASQIDTFDPKSGDIALFKTIDTSVKGVQFAETLPLLAQQAHHMAILRGMKNPKGDHGGATIWMRTGNDSGKGKPNYPDLGSVLAKELGDGKPNLPRFVSIDGADNRTGYGPGFLGAKYGPLLVGRGKTAPGLQLPELDIFAKLDKDNAAALRQSVAKAFDIDDEGAAVRDAYGNNRFGQSCLLARRLIEAGVPVVELTLGGWDNHGNAAQAIKGNCEKLDPGMANLIKDLAQRKLLDNTLVVWMTEFGRTPKINKQKGRDDPNVFSVVLAGAGIKGGQAIGRTSVDGTQVEEGLTTPAQLLATIYQSLGVDPARKNRTADGQDIPLVEPGTTLVSAALR